MKRIARIVCTLLALATVAACTLSFAACGKKADDLETVRKNGKLVVGITEFAPMDYRDADKNWIGFDADAASAFAAYLGVEVEFFQSNHEGALIDEIQRAYFSQVDGIVFNPAGYTHTSVALADAVKAVSIPTVEVHISYVSERETYRQISFVRAVAIDTVEGQGLNGYLIAMDALKNHLINNEG